MTYLQTLAPLVAWLGVMLGACATPHGSAGDRPDQGAPVADLGPARDAGPTADLAPGGDVRPPDDAAQPADRAEPADGGPHLDAASVDGGGGALDASSGEDVAPLPDTSRPLDGSGAPDSGAPDGGAGPAPPILDPQAAWRLRPPDDGGRWWLVSPAGHPTFWLGVNTAMRDASCDGIAAGWIRRMEPARAAHREWARLSSGRSGGEQVDRPYCFNSVGAFSERNDFDETPGDSYLIRTPQAGGAGAPYGVVLHGLGPRGDDRALRDHEGRVLSGGYAGARIGDPFSPAFQADVRAEVRSRVQPRRGDPGLQMWFAGNEIGLFDRADRARPGVRDLRRWIWSSCPPGSTPAQPRCAPHALAAFLAERHGSLDALNVAWESAYPGQHFATIVEQGPRPVPYVQHCNLECREDLQRFVHERLLPAWVELVTGEIRRVDPTHLIATPRLALAAPSAYRFWSPRDDVWADAPEVDLPNDRASVRYRPWRLLGRRGDVGFDLVAVNVYSGADAFPEPWLSQGLERIPGYRLDGQSTALGLEMAFVAPFGVAAMLPEGSAQGWLDRLWDETAQAPEQDYFGDSIKLLSMIVMSGNGWG